MEQLKVLELYSGIGGMHSALKMSGLAGEVVAAVDINHNANLVYKHNYKSTKLIQKLIEGIKLEEYNKLDFDMILMSPPCQPFTRQGNQNGSSDLRAKSFLYLIQLIPKLNKKPKFILMENVKGFDSDEARDLFIQMLNSMNYNYQEFLLSPIQLGIPNSRLRYFLIAKLDESFCFSATHEIMKILPNEAKQFINSFISDLKFKKEEFSEHAGGENEPNETLVEIKIGQLNENYEDCCHSENSNLMVDSVQKLDHFVCNKIGNEPSLLISAMNFRKSSNCIDLVTCDSTRTSCYTKNYGRFMEGTGSILIVKPTNLSISRDETTLKLSHKQVRFLSPREIANLHCFPDTFEFPKELTTVQQWRLIGNSLNVLIVAVLLKLMSIK